jgi:hypothetical protein
MPRRPPKILTTSNTPPNFSRDASDDRMREGARPSSTMEWPDLKTVFADNRQRSLIAPGDKEVSCSRFPFNLLDSVM